MGVFYKKLIGIRRLGGYAMNKTRLGETVKIMCKGHLTSDDPNFFIFMEGITNTFLSPSGLFETHVSNFLIIHHEDLTVDVYANDIPMAIEFLSKGKIKKGQLVGEADIADIGRLRFPDIPIVNTDHIYFCIKRGWKFGYYFDCTANNNSSYRIDMEKMFHEFGSLYKRLAYSYIFKTVAKSGQFEKMKRDGWFPFVELMGNDLKNLSNAYAGNGFVKEARLKILNSFDESRLNKIYSKWWSNPIFSKKKRILMAGINSYLRNDKEGFISCIKNLYSEIHGILTGLYNEDTGLVARNNATLIKHLKERGQSRTGSLDPLYLPEYFASFLENYFFPKFNLITKDIALSRHTSTHGVASVRAYTKTRALQAILILDQIFFFIKIDKKQ